MARERRRGSDERYDQRPRRRWARTGALALVACAFLSVLYFGPLRSHATPTPQPVLLLSRSGVIDVRQPSTGCGKAPPVAAGTTGRGALTSDGRQRTYWLHIPRGYRRTHHYPLVLVFHGHAGAAWRIERGTGFSQLADSAGFLVVYPEGIVGPDHLTGWASGGPHKPRANDVLFASDLLSHVQAEVCVDPSRVYATGFSNGGGMTSVLACALAGRIAAFAPVSGSYFALAGGCHPGRPVPILEIHGTADRIVPYAGRPGIGELGAWQWAQLWAARDGCLAAPTQFIARDGVAGFMWPGCQGHAAVIEYRLIGGVHAWPRVIARARGSLVPLADARLDATLLIWQFFAAHPLTSSSLRAL